MLFLTEDDVGRLLTMRDAIDAVERGLRSQAAGTAFNQPRRRVTIPGGATLHVMSAGDSQAGYLGFKAYSTSRKLARFLVVLYASSTGEPLVQMEADYLGQVRTGAASGVATRHMARAEAPVLAMIGTGQQAFTQAVAVAHVRELREIRVYSRNAERRASFAGEVSEATRVDAIAFDTAVEAVESADIVCTATTSREPVIFGEWFHPGMHINGIGSNSAARREIDEAGVLRADVIVADSIDQSHLEAGELIRAFQDQPEQWERVRELSAVVAGKQPGRELDSQITFFKSNGIALEDVAVAGCVYEQARKQGTGTEIPVFAGFARQS